jgi:hypothetical protein
MCAVTHHGQPMGAPMQVPTPVPAGLTPVMLPPGVTSLNPHHQANLPSSGLPPGVVLLNSAAPTIAAQQQQHPQQQLVPQSLSAGGVAPAPHSTTLQQPVALPHLAVPGPATGASSYQPRRYML